MTWQPKGANKVQCPKCHAAAVPTYCRQAIRPRRYDQLERDTRHRVISELAPHETPMAEVTRTTAEQIRIDRRTGHRTQADVLCCSCQTCSDAMNQPATNTYRGRLALLSDHNPQQPDCCPKHE